jgi:hypothetical protein
MSPKLPLALVLAPLLAPLLGGCARRVVLVEPAPVVVLASPAPVMMIQNQRNDTITSIRMKACGAPETAYRPVVGAKVARGASWAMPLAEVPACVDLVAVGEGGEAVGRQDDMHVAPGARWVIR